MRTAAALFYGGPHVHTHLPIEPLKVAKEVVASPRQTSLHSMTTLTILSSAEAAKDQKRLSQDED
jgi:hypothetical protein